MQPRTGTAAPAQAPDGGDCRGVQLSGAHGRCRAVAGGRGGGVRGGGKGGPGSAALKTQGKLATVAAAQLKAKAVVALVSVFCCCSLLSVVVSAFLLL